MATMWHITAQTSRILAKYLFSGSFLVKVKVLTPLGCLYIGSSSTVMQLILRI